MWKLLLLLACVAGSTIVFCDDSESSYDASSSLSSSSSAASSSSSSSQTSSSSSSSSSSKSSASSQSSSTKIYKHKTRVSDGTDNSSDASVQKPGPVEVDGSDQGSADSDASCDSNSQVDTSKLTPTYKCGPNQVFSNCTNGGCEARNCSQAGKPVPCVKLDEKSCKKGCVCATGYLRASNGTCVLKSQCREGCGDDPNSHPGCGVNCGQTCATYKIKNAPCILLCYLDGCDCNTGYVYDPNVKKCVLSKDCTPTCGLHEVYSTCTNGGCSHRNCSQLGKPKICIDRTPESCTKGCVCAEGYLRNANGSCVLENQCPQIGCGGDPNAQPGCGINCGSRCSDYKIKNKSLLCPRIQCKPDKCDCKPGFVFDNNLKKCVVPEQCTPVCGLNEKYDSCVNGGCGHRNCSQIGTPQFCIDRTSESCIKGCVCADGYLRADNGTCVPQSQCPGCGGDPNAQPGCGINCGRRCSDYKIKNKSLLCPRIQCKPDKCDCKPGFVFDNNLKKCVVPEQCTPVCGLNEKYDSCVNGGCGHRNCSQIGTPQFCIDRTSESCIKGCVCADGYLRADNGTCVPQSQCPGCGGDPNAQPGCGINCGRRCSDYKIKNKALLCPRIQCKPDKCDCKPGFVFDNNLKKCVVPEQCTPVCGLNEKYDSCVNGGCGHRNCSQIGTPQICIDRTSESCIKGCVCADGYLRADNGTCVPQSQCPAPTTDDRCPGQNEYYNTCISGCSTQSCNEIGKVLHCPIQPAVCREGCRCKAGYWRNADNVCVPQSECPAKNNPCKGQNEYYDMCINGCSNQTCETIGKVFNCPIQPAVCRTGCRCNPGFYRNASNVCVAESLCPTPPCPEGEMWNRCPAIACEGDYCPKNRNSPQTCPVGIVCDPPRCTCGLLDKRDRITKKCIKAYTCPPFKCNGPNEHYDSCPAGCPGEACSDYVTGKKCSPFRIGIVVPCRPACRCNTGYYRNSNNTCVKAGECGLVVNTSTNTPVIIESPTTAKPTSGSSTTDAVASLKTGITNFNGEFLYDRLKAEPGKNLITSPYSVFTPLVQLALYATGDSLKQLTRALNVDTKEQIRSGFPALVASFEGQTSVNFSTAAKVYSDLKYPLSDGFKQDSANVVHAEAQELDFSKNTEAANTINSWVESQTNNRIHDLIQPSDLSELTRLVLVNAIYFKGEWHYAFNENNTIKNANFYLSDGSTKKTSLMYQEGQFNYGSVPELNCTVLQMFYKGDNFSMVVVLPNEKDGLLQVAKNLQKQANFDKVIGSLSRQKVKVYLPPFKIETTTDLSDILKQLGITKIFDAKDSGLSGLLKNPEDTYISKAIQKAFIEVNAKGSEAAAANAVIVNAVSAVIGPEQLKFRADRSFLYYILAKDAPLFCGSVVDPN